MSLADDDGVVGGSECCVAGMVDLSRYVEAREGSC